MNDEIVKQLKSDEGLQLKPYRDSVGKLTIGVGRNLDDVGISEGESDVLLWNDVNLALRSVKVALPWSAQMADARQGVLVNMAFNLGLKGLLEFKNMLACMKAGDWAGAAKEMATSKWAQQVGNRAARLAKQLITGEWQYAGS